MFGNLGGTAGASGSGTTGTGFGGAYCSLSDRVDRAYALSAGAFGANTSTGGNAFGQPKPATGFGAFGGGGGTAFGGTGTSTFGSAGGCVWEREHGDRNWDWHRYLRCSTVNQHQYLRVRWWRAVRETCYGIRWYDQWCVFNLVLLYSATQRRVTWQLPMRMPLRK